MFLTHNAFSVLRLTGLTLISAITVGCAQTGAPNYYDPPKASSTQDAIRTAENANMGQVLTAPSQFQVTWQSSGDGGITETRTETINGVTTEQTDQARAMGEDATAISLINKPETFMGNLPCFATSMNCSTQRVLVTLAPNGRWRSRVTYFEQAQPSGQPAVAQGCWRSTLSAPPRLLLLDADQNVRVELRMTANDTLQIVTIDGANPNLRYTLTRQPDLDPVAELDAKPAPVCR